MIGLTGGQKTMTYVKSAVLTAALGLAPTTVHADFLGLHLGIGYWDNEFAGDVVDGVSVGNELGVGEDASLHFYAALEHPIPVIPNIRVARTGIEGSGAGTLASNFTFEGQNFAVGQQVATTIDLTHTDLTLYYEIIDIGFDLDVGITARSLEGQVQMDTTREDVDEVIPMVYLRGKLGLPFTGTYFAGTANALAFGDSEISDYAIAIGWETENFILPEFGIEGGLRRFTIDVQEQDAQVNVDMEVDGIFVNLTAHF
ncbi:MAG: TIGR04219 family outer membrane beta-barrel protein [Pseudomonadota bacterium]